MEHRRSWAPTPNHKETHSHCNSGWRCGRGYDPIHLLTHRRRGYRKPKCLQYLVSKLLQLLKDIRQEDIERIRLSNRHRPARRRRRKRRPRTRSGRGHCTKRRHTRLRNRLTGGENRRGCGCTRRQNRRVNRCRGASRRTGHRASGRRGPSNQRTIRGS